MKPDVIHLWEEPWSAVAAQAVCLRNRLSPHAAIVIEVEQNIDRRLPLPFELVRRFTLKSTDHLIGRHPDAIKVARTRGYTGSDSIVEYGSDPTIFCRVPKKRASLRDQFGAEGLILGYVGRLVPQKGLDDILAALALCRQPASLLILGEGSYHLHLEREVARLGLGARTRFLPASPPSEVARIMAALDVPGLAFKDHTDLA